MNASDASRAIARTEFIESLERHGLRYVDESTFRGTHTTDNREVNFVVKVHETFPFLPPTVLVDPEESVPWSWHRYRDGSMCLYTDDDHGTTPWLDVDAFLAQVGNWIENTLTGWATDNPDMDLERYFAPADGPLLVLYEDLDRYAGPFVMLRTTEFSARVTGEGTAPKKYRTRGRLYGYVADIGTPAVPPRTWDQVMALAHNSDDVTRMVKEGLIDIILVRYRRGDADGVLALRAHWTVSGIIAHTMPAASTDTNVMTMRSGPHRCKLETAHVRVVGGGALGSYIADGLVRAGLSDLTIQDSDVVRPGNLVRHIVGVNQIGMTKGAAIRDYLNRTTYSFCRIEVSTTMILTMEQALKALNSCDLLIDATASSVATSVLGHAARVTGKHMLAACLQNDGEAKRVDVIPPLSGQAMGPTLQRASATPAIYEGGCGSPISQTPAYAVMEAAAMTVAHAIGLLTGEPLSPNGELRDRGTS